MLTEYSRASTPSTERARALLLTQNPSIEQGKNTKHRVSTERACARKHHYFSYTPYTILLARPKSYGGVYEIFFQKKNFFLILFQKTKCTLWAIKNTPSKIQYHIWLLCNKLTKCPTKHTI